MDCEQDSCPLLQPRHGVFLVEPIGHLSEFHPAIFLLCALSPGYSRWAVWCFQLVCLQLRPPFLQHLLHISAPISLRVTAPSCLASASSHWYLCSLVQPLLLHAPSLTLTFASPPKTLDPYRCPRPSSISGMFLEGENQTPGGLHSVG